MRALPSGVQTGSQCTKAGSSAAIDGSGYGVYGRLYNEAGAARGGEFRVNSHTTDYQWEPAVGMDSNGDFVVTHYDYIVEKISEDGAKGLGFNP